MEQKSPKVSVIVPCYNGGWCVARLLNSILAQTYDNIELIFVNDGSTDDTEAVFDSICPALEARGIAVRYIAQANRGLGGAIDTGLANISGEFFCWPDADDSLEPDSIAARVAVFAAHPHAGVVSSAANIKHPDNPSISDSILRDAMPDADHQTLFRRLLQAEGLFCPGCHMARTEAFFAANGRMGIYPARRGQNWQLLLPLYYHFDRVYLDRPLYNYYIYNASMSHTDNSYEKRLYRAKEHENIICSTLSEIVMSDAPREMYSKVAKTEGARRRLELANAYGKKADAREAYLFLAAQHAASARDRFMCYTTGSRCVASLRKLRRKLLRR